MKVKRSSAFFYFSFSSPAHAFCCSGLREKEENCAFKSRKTVIKLYLGVANCLFLPAHPPVQMHLAKRLASLAGQEGQRKRDSSQEYY